MQLACKTALLKHKGRQMVKQLVQHGANLVSVRFYKEKLQEKSIQSLYLSSRNT